MTEYFKAFVFIPDIETTLDFTPEFFHKFKNLIGVIDCTEVFIETPKDLDLQKATWREYKHHKTVKLLVCKAPNSSVLFFSGGFIGHISDEILSRESWFLDESQPHTPIMIDRGNISNMIFIVNRKMWCLADDTFRSD